MFHVEHCENVENRWNVEFGSNARSLGGSQHQAGGRSFVGFEGSGFG